MALFFVDYDLRKQHDYSKLINELTRLGAKRLLKSSWCLTINNSAEQVRDHLMQFIDADDGLWVAQISDWATFKTTTTPKQLAAA